MDTLALARALPDNSINCVVTSPPYWMQRKYGVAGEWGSERTLAEYIDNLVILFREIRRVLRPDGVLWLNLGDKYNGGGNGGNASKQVRYDGFKNKRTRRGEFKHKDLMFLPHRVAIALQDDGWYARQDNVWFKPNPLPESVKDRSTRAHEYVFQFTKSPDYWYDPEPVKTPVKPTSIKRRGRAIHADQKYISGAPGQVTYSMFAPRVNTNRNDSAGSKSRNNFDEKYEPKGSQRNHGAGTPLPGRQTFNERYAGKFDDSRFDQGGARQNGFDESYSGQAEPKANLRSVWKISPVGFKDAHFATFPPRIPEIAILTSCPPYTCPNCGTPWLRCTEKDFHPQGDVSPERSMKNAPGQKPMANENRWGNYQRGSIAIETTGWRQACSCHPGLVPEPGLVYDPFMGSGTTALVAEENGRNWIGAELNGVYVQMANRRIAVARSPGLDDFFKALTVWASQFEDLPLFQRAEVSTQS
jgi:site-specific DNA-methyltransferase (adenine-specific)